MKKRCLAQLICLVLLSTSCQEGKKAEKLPPQVPVAEVKASIMPLEKTYIGTTLSMSNVAIRARVEGFLDQMNFVEGKPVKKGQLLFVIDPRPFQAQLQQSQGDLSSSVATKEYQNVQYLRLKQLVGKGDIAKSDYDQTVSQLRQAEADVMVKNAQVQQAQINLSYCYMYSPFDGVVGRRFVDVGNLVGNSDNTLLAYVVQLNPIYVEFYPSVADYTLFLKYRKNMPFNVEATLPLDKDLIFKGKLNLVNNQADISTSTIYMRSTVENPEMLLLPGIYVNVKVTLTPSHPVLLIPASAITEIQGERFVIVVNDQNKLESRLVQTETLYGTNYVVTGGIKSGEKVAVSGLQMLKPGMTVRPILVSSEQAAETKSDETKPAQPQKQTEPGSQGSK